MSDSTAAIPPVQTVVFDLGGVLLTWDPRRIVAQVFADDERRQRALRGVFGHPDWKELDRGTLQLEQALSAAVARTGLAVDELRALYDAVPASLQPIPETVALLEQTVAAGRTALCMSNMPVASMAYIEREHAFWRLFDGAVISSRERANKPEPEIYRILLTRHGLDPAATVFIDDTLENIVAAREHGIHGIHFQGVTDCARELQRLGCL